jgi:pimeloyl-ACP methyl ester carboxylesterase
MALGDAGGTGRRRGELRSGFVQVGSLRLHHTVGGRGAPPVVFVHGLGSSGYIEWRFNLPSLAGSRRVLAPDLPGFGRSEKRSVRYGVPLFAKTLEGYLRALRLRPAVLVGASLGGRVVMELAIRRPEMVRKVVLVNALGLGRPNLRFAYPMLTLPRVGEAMLGLLRSGLQRSPGGSIRRLARRYLGSSGDLERTMDDAYLAELRELHEAEGYHQAYLATVRSLARPASLLQGPQLVARLRQTGLPVLLVWGADDPLFPLEHAEKAHRDLPGSRLAVIEGAGHTPQAERPDEFNRILRSFLAG